jgi:hypothetical protein
MFGFKDDGSIDPEVAASQMTELLSKMAGPSNPLSTEEKTVLHDLISGFARAFAPAKETALSMEEDFQNLIQTFSGVLDNSKLDKADSLLGATNLLSLFTDDKPAFDFKLLADLTDKFLTTMEKKLPVSDTTFSSSLIHS